VKKSDITPSLLEIILSLVDEGITDTEISKQLGIDTGILRDIRDENDRERSTSRRKYSVSDRNDVIEMIREEYTLSEISNQTGIHSQKIKEWRDEELLDENILPEIKMGVARRQKYTDEELIELAYLNPGYGFKRFIKYLGVRDNFVLELFLELKQFTDGHEDPLATLQDSSPVQMVTRQEYHEITGRKYAPRGSGLSTSRGSGAIKGVNARDVPLPPQEFNWGPYSPKEWHNSDNPRHQLNGSITVDDWVNQKLNKKGYISFNEDHDDFADLTGAGKSRGTFTKWMNRAGLFYDNRYGYWIENDRTD